MRFLIFLILFWNNIAWSQALIGNVVRLSPSTVPALCNNGDLRTDQNDSNKLKLCTNNTWQEFLSTISGIIEGVAPINDNGIAKWYGTSGNSITSSGVLIDASNNISGAQSISAVATTLSGLTASKVVVTDSNKALSSSAVTSIELLNLSGSTQSIQTALNSLIIPGTNTLYVDGNRTDSYTQTGTFANPYKTIQAAINAAVTLASSENVSILVASHKYLENLTVNQAIVSLSISCLSGDCWIGLNNGSPALNSSSNNNSMTVFGLNGFTVNGDINFIPSANNPTTCLSGCSFTNLNIINSHGFTLKNNYGVNIDTCYWEGDLIIENIFGVVITNSRPIGAAFTITTNTGNNRPSGLTETDVYVEDTSMSFTSGSLDAASYLQINRGTRFGSNGSTFTINGFVDHYNSELRSAITINSGGELDNYGGFWRSTITTNAGGTFYNDNTANKIAYTPATSGNWNSVPTESKGALDTLATSGVVKSQSQNLILASPNGSSGVSSFRSLVAADIAANLISLGKLAQVSTATFLGRTSASTGDVESLTATQATALLNNVVGDSGSGGTKGLAPAPSAGDAAAGKFLNAGGTYSVPSSGSGAWSVTATKTANYTAVAGEFVPCNTNAFNLTLPTAASISGQKIKVIKIGADTNAITILTTSSQTVGARASGTILLRQLGDYIEVISDGSNWFIADKKETQFIMVSNSLGLGTIGAGNYGTLATSAALTYGIWKLTGQFAIEVSNSTAPSVVAGAGFYAADGANSSSVPTSVTGLISGSADWNGGWGIIPLTFAAVGANSRITTSTNIIVLSITSNQTVYLVPQVDYSVAGAAAVYTRLVAERMW